MEWVIRDLSGNLTPVQFSPLKFEWQQKCETEWIATDLQLCTGTLHTVKDKLFGDPESCHKLDKIGKLNKNYVDGFKMYGWMSI